MPLVTTMTCRRMVRAAKLPECPQWWSLASWHAVTEGQGPSTFAPVDAKVRNPVIMPARDRLVALPFWNWIYAKVGLLRGSLTFRALV